MADENKKLTPRDLLEKQLDTLNALGLDGHDIYDLARGMHRSLAGFFEEPEKFTEDSEMLKFVNYMDDLTEKLFEVRESLDTNFAILQAELEQLKGDDLH
jgi:hypothetical protein